MPPALPPQSQFDQPIYVAPPPYERMPPPLPPHVLPQHMTQPVIAPSLPPRPVIQPILPPHPPLNSHGYSRANPQFTTHSSPSFNPHANPHTGFSGNQRPDTHIAHSFVSPKANSSTSPPIDPFVIPHDLHINPHINPFINPNDLWELDEEQKKLLASIDDRTPPAYFAKWASVVSDLSKALTLSYDGSPQEHTSSAATGVEKPLFVDTTSKSELALSPKLPTVSIPKVALPQKVASQPVSPPRKTDFPVKNPVSPPKPPPPAEVEAKPPEMIEKSLLASTRVSFGPGAEVLQVITGFESCRVSISNLPHNIPQSDILCLVEPFGDAKKIAIIAKSSPPTSTAMVDFVHPDKAKLAASALHASMFHSRRLSVRLEANYQSASGLLRNDTVRVSWFKPCMMAWAHYRTSIDAKRAAAAIDGRMFKGRKLSATFQPPSKGQTTSFSVVLKGVPASFPYGDLRAFCDAEKITKGTPTYVGDDVVAKVRELLSDFGPLETYDLDSRSRGDSKYRVLARFSSADAAAAAASTLHDTKPGFLGDNALWVQPVISVRYKIGRGQYFTLKSQFDAMQEEGLSKEDDVRLRVILQDSERTKLDPIFLRIYSDDVKKLAVSKLKIDKILAGEPVKFDSPDALNDFFTDPSSGLFLSHIRKMSEAYAVRDNRRRTLTLYGSEESVSKAKDVVAKELERRQAQRHIIQVERYTVQWLMTGGLGGLRERLGRDRVYLNIITRTLFIRGTNADLQWVNKELNKARQRTFKAQPNDCPVCFCPASNPIGTGCGHTYCRPCLRLYLLSTADTRVFPVTCLGRDGQCKAPIPLWVFKQVLTPDEEEKVFEGAFLSYIHERPAEFHYCPTPDCPQIYRPAPDGTVLECRSCLCRICPACHVEYHENFTCEQHRDHTSGGHRAYQEWKVANDVKSCPNCSTDIEKESGCNHMTCIRCKTHICWVCMSTFPGGDGIYAHMRAAHGGIGL
ncbi:hypothetical protein BOTBODRAFT_170315 [Botryobasidium botryosum FD-172 SS1]|uniref:RING-type domain-containing protein n=1 Tax=Botryobasidium botryosum (strain FD-172 SS1) TaxID=930990 RepID=A0A067N092_BOTB1|nr:hypothetical protein BOTBODRAFT_170315 [Botryobasidium botryosum FD-172 SS1]